MKISREQHTDNVALSDNDCRFRSISDGMPVLIAQLDLCECFRFHNKFHLNWFSRSNGEINGRHIKEIFGNTAYQQLKPYIRTALTGGRASAELKVDIPELGKRHLIIHVVPDKLDGGEIQGCFTLMNDITRVKTEQLEKSQHLLKTAHQSRIHTMGEMLAEISHELNQPLTAISNYSAAGLQRFEKQRLTINEFADLLTNIDAEIHRAIRIINHIRGFSRKRSMQLEVVNVNHLIKDVLELLTCEFHWHGIGLTTNLQTSGIQVNVDRILMEQVILNIIRNAIEALASVERTGREIIITSYRSESNIVIDIYNNGSGLSDELMNRIFEPFFTTKPEGLGIGLSTSQSIMTSFSGKLWVKQNSRDGITFEIQLPAWR